MITTQRAKRAIACVASRGSWVATSMMAGVNPANDMATAIDHTCQVIQTRSARSHKASRHRASPVRRRHRSNRQKRGKCFQTRKIDGGAESRGRTSDRRPEPIPPQASSTGSDESGPPNIAGRPFRHDSSRRRNAPHRRSFLGAREYDQEADRASTVTMCRLVADQPFQRIESREKTSVIAHGT